jgi:hypothetical protein
VLAFFAFVVSLFAAGFTYFVWQRSARPIVTVAVKEYESGDAAITYNLEVLNSGTIPAKNVRIMTEQGSLAAALGADATAENKQRWLACLDVVILLLRPNEPTTCSFGTTMANDTGFWKYKAIIPITVIYEDWFGSKYAEKQNIQIFSSDSFTGYSWGERSKSGN